MGSNEALAKLMAYEWPDCVMEPCRSAHTSERIDVKRSSFSNTVMLMASSSSSNMRGTLRDTAIDETERPW